MLGAIPPVNNYTLGGVSCNEVAIDGVVVRVFLERFNFDEYFTNKNEDITLVPRKRGRKRKLTGSTSSSVIGETSEDDFQKRNSQPAKHKAIKKPGRPRKVNLSEESQKLDEESVSSDINEQFDKQKRLNGGQNLNNIDTYSNKRVRKPNSRLSDFVISKDKRSYKSEKSSMQSSQAVEEVISEELQQQKSATHTGDGADEATSSDPLDISNADDVVHSFLPQFDETPTELNDLLIVKSSNADQPKVNNTVKEKENNKDDPPVDDVTIKSEDTSPPKDNTRMQTSPPKSPKFAVSPPVKQYRKRGRPPLHNRNRYIPQKKPRVIKVEKDFQDLFTNEPTQSDSETEGDSSQKQTEYLTYILVNDDTENRTSTSKGHDVDFNKLVRCLKMVKLPAANWKIRIVVSRQQIITEVTFTNKEENERCVKFSRVFSGYVVTFGNKNVKLLGAPGRITSYNDITVLLTIIHNIKLNDPILEYNS